MKLPPPGCSEGQRASLCGCCALCAKCRWWLVNTDKCLFKSLFFLHWQRTLIDTCIGQWRHPVANVFSDWQIDSGFCLPNQWKADVKKGIFRRVFFSLFKFRKEEKSSKCNTVKIKVCRRNYVSSSCHLKGYWPRATVKHTACSSSAEGHSTCSSHTHVNHLIKCSPEARPTAHWHRQFRFKLLS